MYYVYNNNTKGFQISQTYSNKEITNIIINTNIFKNMVRFASMYSSITERLSNGERRDLFDRLRFI